GLPLKLPLFLLGVVFAQAAFGMWTVTLKLWPQVVTGHLLGGFATLSLLFLLTLRLSGVLPALTVPKRLQYWATAGLLLVIGQIALGGWV
ncbi:COX15/CtaA family protein, partial [Pseudomonas sp. SAICEU22]